MIILGQGAARLSASGLHELVQLTKEQLRETISQRETGGKIYRFEQLSGETKRLCEEMGKGKEEETTSMNKKEISEIKKQLTPENCALTRLCACYVDGEKNKKTEMKEAFLSQSEEECFKYFEIFRKSLSGTVGKNLINLEFPLDAELEMSFWKNFMTR